MRIAPWLLLLSALAPAAQAQTRAGTAFLKIDTSARATALGGAYTAVSDDATSLRYNPAGLSRAQKRELSATHSEWLLGSRFDFIGYAQPTSHGTFGLGITRLAVGTIEGRDSQRQLSSDFKASDMAYALGYGRGVDDLIPGGKTHLGASVKYIDSKIGSDSASTLALDLGALQRFSARPLDLGVSVLNIGNGIKFLDQTDPLPLTLSLGAAYSLSVALKLALDVRQNIPDERTGVGMGAEYTVFSSFALRAGYASSSGADSSLGGLSGGFGLRLADYSADYTFTPFGALGNVQRISLGARF
jgi:hypothetical protein